MGMQTIWLILFHEAIAVGNKDADLARFNGFGMLNEQIVTIMVLNLTVSDYPCCVMIYSAK